MNTYGDIRIGISGWRYKGWRGVFYTEDLPQKRELEYASRVFRSIAKKLVARVSTLIGTKRKSASA